MSSATISSLDYESLTVIIVACVTVLGIIRLAKLLVPALERMQERAMTVRPPARQATLEMESGPRASSSGAGMTTTPFGSFLI